MAVKDGPTAKIAEYVANLFTNDAYVQQEYAAGMNMVTISPMSTSGPLTGIVEILQASLMAGEQVNCLLLSRVSEAQEDSAQIDSYYYYQGGTGYKP